MPRSLFLFPFRGDSFDSDDPTDVEDPDVQLIRIPFRWVDEGPPYDFHLGEDPDADWRSWHRLWTATGIRLVMPGGQHED